MFPLCETEKIEKKLKDWLEKNISIFGVRMFAVNVEASIEVYCFIPTRHRVRYSFCFFTLSVEKP